MALWISWDDTKSHRVLGVGADALDQELLQLLTVCGCVIDLDDAGLESGRRCERCEGGISALVSV